MKIEIDKIYICHYTKLIERKKLLLSNLSNCEIFEYEWVETFDKDNLNKIELECEFQNLFKPNVHGRYLKNSEISIALKHIWIIQESFRKNYESILVLEDDSIIREDFVDKFNLYKSQLPTDWDICFIGECCGLHTPSDPNKYVYKVNQSRCAHAYIVSRRCLSKIIDHIGDVNDAIDWYFTTLINKFDLNCFWFEPSIVSQNKNFITSIQNEN